METQIEEYKISGPYNYKNLILFLFHSEDRLKSKDFLTLQEALEQKKAVVHETGNVNELAVEKALLQKPQKVSFNYNKLRETFEEYPTGGLAKIICNRAGRHIGALENASLLYNIFGFIKLPSLNRFRPRTLAFLSPIVSSFMVQFPNKTLTGGLEND